MNVRGSRRGMNKLCKSAGWIVSKLRQAKGICSYPKAKGGLIYYYY